MLLNFAIQINTYDNVRLKRMEDVISNVSLIFGWP